MAQAKVLRDLLADVGAHTVDGDADVVIRAITHDSRLVRPGTLFVAYEGVHQDVHRYLPDAAERGAAAALVEQPIERLRADSNLSPELTLVRVPNARLARGLVASALFDHPSRAMDVVGVTGTDGKTSTVTLLHAMLTAAGRRAGLVSTVAARIGDDALNTGLHVTTPDPEDLQAYLARMRAAGTDVAVLEVTSHGLHQHRVAGVAFDVAVLTNITRHEALEYHGTFDAYQEAKAMLFRALSSSPNRPGVHKTAVLNAADSSFGLFRQIPVARRVTYCVSGKAQYTARDIAHDTSGLQFTAVTPHGRIEVRSPLLGAYNAGNILAAMAAASALGAKPEAWRTGARQVTGIPGRMETVDEGQDFLAIVDFAHTPNALANALSTARDLAGPAGRVLVVFGCAGLRDPGKRSAMGRVAAEMADRTFVTSEDPRTEAPEEIMAAIAQGLTSAGGVEDRDFLLIADRGEAILRACQTARPNDVVIVCGKGHEQSMCFGEVEYPWDDRAALRSGLRGHPDRRLPTSRHPGAR